MEISDTPYVIDSRDVIKRIEELESEIEDIMEENENYADEANDEYWERKEELDKLKELEEEASGSPDWEHGEILIREDYFAEYTEELCKDIGYISRDFPEWIVIDWEATAENVKQDYISVKFGGETYYIRA